MSQPKQQDLIQRYSGAQRLAHGILTLAFFALAFTGLLLWFPSLSGLAAGGISRMVHRVGAAILLLVPVYYLVADRAGLKRLLTDSFRFDADDRKWLKAMPRYVFGHAKGMPPQGRINAGEKLHHAAIIILYVTVAVSGLFMWAGKPMLGAAAFNWMVVAHNVSMFLMLVLTIGHMYFVFVYGALGTMIHGHVTRAYAQMEHAKWLAEIDAVKGKGRKPA